LEVIFAVSLEESQKEFADKSELLLAMAKFNGFSLEDLIEEATKKRHKNGGFDKRLFLEKVLK